MSIFQKIKSLHLPKRMLFPQSRFYSFQPRKIIFCVIVSVGLFFFHPVSGLAQQMESDEEAVDANTINTEEENTIVYKKEIYHKHLGNSNGGGCYSIQRTGTRTEEISCGGSMVYWPDIDKSQCSRCGAGYYGDQSYRSCWHSETRTTSYTYYDLGCGKGTDTCLGTLTVKQSTKNWTKSLTLTAEYENTGNMVIGEKPYIWNGAEAVAENVYPVNASGTYTLQLNADAYANTQAAIITVDIRNVDVTPPVIKSHKQEPAADWTKDGVLVSITESVDLQPDGSEGCGLHAEPFSYDDGNTWTSENSYFYQENGTHSILIRDRLDNVSSYEVAFENIDHTPPTIESLEYDDKKNIPSTQIMITALDLQPDGSPGCGLHKMPYSYDGGQTWTSENTYAVCKNGTYHIVVRDVLDNRRTIEEEITNIDCVGPRIHYTMVSDSWTNQDVSLYLSASDVNEDGSAGIGLEDTWYSLDGGHSWSNQTPLVFEENTSFTIKARDKLNNYSSVDIRIIQIDKVQPWASLTMQVEGAGPDMKVKLIASGGDDYSGIAEDGFSWDRGSSYTDQSSKIVTENGLYQVYVKDKAGNSNNAVIEVDVFPAFFPILPLLPEETEEAETQTEEETEELQTEEVCVTLEERIEAPQETPVHVLERDSIWDKLLFFLFFLLGVIILALLFILLWSRTIAVYVKKADGKQQYMGRRFIARRDERYLVTIPDALVEKAMTMQFRFRPSVLFVDSHHNEEMHFLFPEGVCITLTIERNMEIE